MKVELSNGAITASTTDEYKVDARAIDVTVHTTDRKSKLDVSYWHKERTMEDYISLRVDIEEQWYEQPEDDKTGRIESAGKLTQFLSLDQARDQVHALNRALAESGDFVSIDKVDPVEHSVDLDILAQTIADHISCNPDEYDLAQDIAEALKAEFKGQSVHMRENEPVANHEAPTRISDLAGSRLEPGR
tara:strand:+ start:476 stop:1042 length:567 start_codon:yes stop_codon:yes gene_type:complete